MKITDKVYGKVDIEEPVLIELIKSTPLQRIEKINQAGTHFVVTRYRGFSRFDHCVGVMVLLKKYGASLEEQVAGLLHDVPHTAFSHTIDYAVGEGEEQTFHERFKDKIIFNSEIPKILKKHRLSVKRVVDDRNFPLLEKPLPYLCADRIDYFLKDLALDRKKLVNPNVYLNHLKVRRNQFIFDDLVVAKKFALGFMKTCLDHFVSPITLATFKILGDVINRAIKTKALTRSDLFTDDEVVYGKLKKSKDALIKKNLSLLTPKLRVKTVSDGHDFHIKGKVRYVDPKILINGKIQKLSHLDASYKEIISLFKEKVRSGHKIKIVRG
jgi:HD superfamily phosphohydrolase